MSYFVSPVLGMSLPNAGTAQAFEIAVQNANMALIEGGFTSDRTTLSTHTTQIATLNGGTGRGTLADYKVATPAALQALTGMVFGDVAVMAGDGTNFTQAVFQYNGTKWAAPVVQFTTAAGAMAAFVTYLALGTNANIILTGGTGLINGIIPVWSNGTRWAKLGVLAPTAAPTMTGAGNTAVINDDGTVTCTFTNVAGGTAIFQGVNPTVAAQGSDTSDCMISFAGSATNLSIALAVATAPSITNYYVYGGTTPQTGVRAAVAAAAPPGNVNWTPLGGAIGGEINLELRHANTAVATHGFVRGKGWAALATSETQVDVVLTHTPATAYDAMEVVVSAATVLTFESKVRW